MNKEKIAYTKLGAAAMFGAPSLMDAALVHFDIPDTVLPAPTVEGTYTYLAFDLNSQTAVLGSYVKGSGFSYSVIAGAKGPGFNPKLGAYSGREYGEGGYTVTYGSKMNAKSSGGYAYAKTTSTKAPYGKGGTYPNFYTVINYFDGANNFSPYFPANNSTRYQYFESPQAAFGWLEMSLAPTGELTISGIFFEPIPESSTTLAITTALAGCAFIYSRRRRKNKAEAESE